MCRAEEVKGPVGKKFNQTNKHQREDKSERERVKEIGTMWYPPFHVWGKTSKRITLQLFLESLLKIILANLITFFS